MEGRNNKQKYQTLENQTPQTLTSFDQFDAPQKQVSFGPDLIKLDEHESLYAALRKKGLLREPSIPKNIGLHLIQDGQIGLSLNSGNPEFLAPGRHTLKSPLKDYQGKASITDAVIKLGPIQIVTVKQGEIGLSVKNGENHILEAGRYILRAPHQFIGCKNLNEEVIHLGTHWRITIPQGFVAIVRDNGKQGILKAEDSPFITNSPTFFYDPATGCQSIQIRDVKLDELVVNTSDPIPFKVIGQVLYKITDPQKAFLDVKDVHGIIRQQAEATLTSAFGKLSVDQIGKGLASAHTQIKEGKKEIDEKEIPADFYHQATKFFIDEFKGVVRKWGVELDTLNIFKIEYQDKNFSNAVTGAVTDRTQKNMQAVTNLENIERNNEVARKTAENEKQLKILKAEGDAESMKRLADAEFYVAQKHKEGAEELSQQPLAAELALMKGTAEIAEKMGDKTTFIPHGVTLGTYSLKDVRNQTLFTLSDNGRNNPSNNSQQIFDDTMEQTNISHSPSFGRYNKQN